MPACHANTAASATGGSRGTYSREVYSYTVSTGNSDKKAWLSYSYSASVSCAGGNCTLPHAASAYGTNSYTYDCNGNMITRVVGGQTYILTYDAENRLVSVSGAVTASFVYDGDSKGIISDQCHTINGCILMQTLLISLIHPGIFPCGVNMLLIRRSIKFVSCLIIS
jgi:hypothetical protein